jgi:Mrp family chromosome partitioning ATPase
MIRLHILRVIIFALIGLAIGAAVFLLSPKVYESRVQLLVGADSGNANRMTSSTLTSDVQNILQRGEPSQPITELNILRSESLFYAAAQKVAKDTGKQAIGDNYERLYKMYDVYGDKESNAALILARAYDKKDAAALATAAADVYNDYRKQAQRDAVSQAQQYLESQIKVAEKELDDARKKLSDAKLKGNIADVQASGGASEQFVRQQQAEYDRANADYQASMAERSRLEGALASLPLTETRSTETSLDPVVTDIRRSITDLEGRRAQLVAKYFENAEEVKEVDRSLAKYRDLLKVAKRTEYIKAGSNEGPSQLQQTMRQLRDQAAAREAGAERRMATAQQALNNALAEKAKLPEAQREIEKQEIEMKTKESNYTRLRLMFDDLKNRTEVAARAAVVLFTAQQRDDPVAPNAMICALVGLIGGAVFGLLFSFTLESLRVRIYSSAQLNEFTGYPVAAVVPAIPGPTARRLLGQLNTNQPRLFEGYRYLAYTSPISTTGQTRRILFTGVDFSDGCSTSAAQFATALSNTGSKVMLVDADLQSQTITRVFEAENIVGVGDILAKTMIGGTGEPLGKATVHPNLRVMPAGKESPTTIKDAQTPSIEALVQLLSQGQNVVVFDSPPCTIASDATRLVPFVDEVYLVVSAKHATLKLVAAGIDVLTQAGAKEVKFIFTHASMGEEGLSKQALYSLGYKHAN